MLIVETGLIAVTWAADLTDPDDVAAVTAHVRSSLAADSEDARRQFLDSAQPGELDADPIGTAAVLAFGISTGPSFSTRDTWLPSQATAAAVPST
ncbi:hypothetical protein [Streptomyces sp. NPDC001880]